MEVHLGGDLKGGKTQRSWPGAGSQAEGKGRAEYPRRQTEDAFLPGSPLPSTSYLQCLLLLEPRGGGHGGLLAVPGATLSSSSLTLTWLPG